MNSQHKFTLLQNKSQGNFAILVEICYWVNGIGTRQQEK